MNWGIFLIWEVMSVSASYLQPSCIWLLAQEKKIRKKKSCSKTKHEHNNEETMQRSQPGMKNYLLKLRGQVSHQLDFNNAWQKCLYL